MPSVNKVTIIGRLGRDPEVRYMPSGGAVCNLQVATSETWKDKTSGEKQERTEWHNCVLYGKTAEIAGQYLKKGSECYLEGSLRTEKWTDKDGKDRYTTKVVVREMIMLGGKSADAKPHHKPGENVPAGEYSTDGSGGGFDDYIPFSPVRWDSY